MLVKPMFTIENMNDQIAAAIVLPEIVKEIVPQIAS
jgi:hypothetical protein